MNITLSTIVLILGLFSFFGWSKPEDSFESPKLVERAIELSDKRELTNESPDVLTATNIEQWKSLIKNLKLVPSLPNYWGTEHPPGCVILKSKGEFIVYKMASVDVSVFNNEGDVLEAEIYTPKMDIVETHELGLKICKMFGFDAAKFDAWCKSVGNNWLDSSLIDVGDHNHGFRILHSYNDQQPWIMIFIIQPEKAYSEFMRKVEQQAQSSKPPSQSNTNDLVAVALKTNTREVWLNMLYQDINADPNIDEETVVYPAAELRTIRAMTNFLSAQLFRASSPTNKMSDVEKISEVDKQHDLSK